MMRRLTKTILVRNLEIEARIGVHPHEKRAPQRVLVSAEIELAGEEDEQDRIQATLDYDTVCDFIRQLGGSSHIELQETIARRVLEFVLSRPGVRRAVVETRKPDVFADCEFVGIRMAAENLP